MRLASRLALVALTFAAAACGSGISSKEDAAKAANLIAGTGSSAQSGFGALVAQGAAGDVSITVPGKSGTAKLTITTSAEGGNADLSYTIVYDGFSANGDDTLDGSMNYRVHTAGDAAGGSMRVETKMSGTVSLSGTFDSEVEMDVTMAVDVVGGAGGGSVTLVMDGFVKADGATYSYAKESVTVDVDA